MSRLLTKQWLFTHQRSLFVGVWSKHAAKILSCNCYLHSGNISLSNSEATSFKVDKYGYGYDSDGKRDKNAQGLLSLTKIDLPEQLEINLKTYLKRFPKKILENDGRKLSRHLRNRGRPTERTWRKYKESKAARKLEDLKVKLDDIKKLEQEQESSAVIGEYDLNKDEAKSLEDEDEDAIDVENVTPKKTLADILQLDEEQKSNNKDTDCKTDKDKIESEEGKVVNEEQKEAITKRPKREEYKVIRYNKRESAAFAASRIQSSYGSTLRVLHEISKREPDYKPETLLDFGSGTGTVVWAAHSQWSDSIKEYQCVDVSQSMNEIAEFLLRGNESYRMPLHIPYVYFSRFLPISNEVTYDIVVSSYSLSEIPRIATRKEAIRNLWAKTNDFLVLVEYGNNEGFDILLEARSLVEKDKNAEMTEEGRIEVGQENPFSDIDPIDEGHVFAPCPHDTTCARSDVDKRDHPCNFEQRVQLAFAEKHTSLKKWGSVNERFSYLVLRKGSRDKEDKPWPRILEDVKLRGRHVICKVCSCTGDIEQKILTKGKDSDIYKCARHLTKWGDLMPMPRDRIRPLKNPDIKETRKGKIRK